MVDHDPATSDLAERLRRLADEPVPSHLRDAHLSRMAATTASPGRRFGRLAVAGAAIAGFLAGSTGLAMAGALPTTAQDVAHDVLAVVQIDVPEGKRGPCVSAIAKSDLSKEEKKAAKAECPKGGKSGDAPGVEGDLPHSDDPCRGRPAWAGKNDLTKEQKAALKADRAALCGPDDDVEGDEEVEDQELDDVDSGPDAEASDGSGLEAPDDTRPGQEPETPATPPSTPSDTRPGEEPTKPTTPSTPPSTPSDTIPGGSPESGPTG